MNAPCYQCPNRYEGCHAVCLAYLAWQLEREEMAAKKRETQDADAHTRLTIERNQRRAKVKKKVRGQM